jgi:hypothetical protein
VEELQRVMLLLDPPPGPEIPDKEMGFHTTITKPVRLCLGQLRLGT